MSVLRTPGRVVVVATAALLGATAVWGVGEVRSGPEAARAPQAAGASLVEERTVAVPRPAPVARAAPAAPRRTVAPRRLVVPSLDLALPVAPYGVDRAGAMALPPTPREAAWYRHGPGPLDPRGATVVAGHVDTAEEGVGPLAALGAVRRGATIELQAGDRTVRYRVREVREVAKTDVDLDALFSRTGAPRLHLVTCGGEYDADRGGYQANVVVVADRVGR